MHISCDLNDTHDITAKTNAFISQVNTLDVKFNGVSSNVRGKLLQAYCCTWDGCQPWDLNAKAAHQMSIEWNKAVRRTLHIPYDMHTRLLPLILGGGNFKDQHRSRVSKFLCSFNISNNEHIRYIGQRAHISTWGHWDATG